VTAGEIVVVTLAESLAALSSAASLSPCAMLTSGPPGCALETLRVSVKPALAPAPRAAMLQATDPVPPTPGAAQLKAGPESCVNDTNVVWGGSVSNSCAFGAGSGPAFDRVSE
jgi:hypothetical protein